MYKHAALAVAAAVSAKLASATVTPTYPYGSIVENTGSTCEIEWDLDTTGSWTDMKIQLMTGDNYNMIALETVADSMDGTTGDGKYSWTCPDVSPNAQIYFYQFTNNGLNATWTTRFTIASASGATTEPTNSTVYSGTTVSWGTGSLVGASTGASTSAAASSSSATAATTTASSSSSSKSSSSSSSASSSSAAAAGTTIVTVTPSSTASSTASDAAASAVKGASAATSSSDASASTTSSSSGASAQHGRIAGAGLALALFAGALLA